jgi:hypothetical protein
MLTFRSTLTLFTRLLLTLLDGGPTGIHGRAVWGSRRGTRRGSHGDGSANHRDARGRMMVPAAFHFDAPIDVDVVDAVSTAAPDIVGTGIRPASPTSPTRLTSPTSATSPTRLTSPTGATSATSATSPTATPTRGNSVGGHGEADQKEGGH